MWKLWRPEVQGGIHVCGCGHSGTSILTRLIGAHSQIYALPGETGIAKKERYSIYRKNVEIFEHEMLCKSATNWAEKTPKHIRNLRFILNCAPATQIVLIVRNPKDTIASLKRRYGSLEKSIGRWKSDNAKVLHWSRHPQCIAIKYENLITNTEPTMARVMEFLGQSFEPEQLNFHAQQVNWYQAKQSHPPSKDQASLGDEANPAIANMLSNKSFEVSQAIDESLYGIQISHNAYRNQQINQPLFNNIGSHRKYLTDAEVIRIQRTCSRLALALGYDKDDANGNASAP